MTSVCPSGYKRTILLPCRLATGTPSASARCSALMEASRAHAANLLVDISDLMLNILAERVVTDKNGILSPFPEILAPLHSIRLIDGDNADIVTWFVNGDDDMKRHVTVTNRSWGQVSPFFIWLVVLVSWPCPAKPLAKHGFVVLGASLFKKSVVCGMGAAVLRFGYGKRGEYGLKIGLIPGQ